MPFYHSSTQKLLGSETKIPLASIAYIQVGAEELDEAHKQMVEPRKTINGSPASIFISAGEASVRIRLPDDTTAALVETELRSAAKAAREEIEQERDETSEEEDEEIERASERLSAGGVEFSEFDIYSDGDQDLELTGDVEEGSTLPRSPMRNSDVEMEFNPLRTPRNDRSWIAAEDRAQ